MGEEGMSLAGLQPSRLPAEGQLPRSRRKVALNCFQRGWIRGSAVRFSATLSLLSVLALGGCAIPDSESFRAPDTASLFTGRSVTNYKDKVLPPVAAEDMVDAGGRCAGAMVPVAASGQPGQRNVSLPEAGVPMIPSAIALEMSECDVVKRAGFPERVEIGTNEAGERNVTLTYINGQRPGVYTFRAGRLAAMERAPEPATPPKPAKKNAKPVKRAAKPAQVSVQ
jgi:hypothetical protein